MYLGHVNIYVRNAERAHEWYTRVLGLHTYHHVPGRAAFLSADLDQSHEVALMQVGEGAAGQVGEGAAGQVGEGAAGQVNEDAAAPRRGQIGLNHMAWMVDSLDALKTAYQRLKDTEVPIDAVVDHGISLGIYFRDPDGNGLEVSYELPRAQWPRQDQVFGLPPDQRGRFPGPWDSDPGDSDPGGSDPGDSDRVAAR